MLIRHGRNPKKLADPVGGMDEKIENMVASICRQRSTKSDKSYSIEINDEKIKEEFEQKENDTKRGKSENVISKERRKR